MRYLSLLLLSLSYIPWAASSREGGNYRDEQRQSSFTASSVKHPLRSSKILSSSTIDQIEQLRTKYRIQGLTIAVVEHQSLAPQEEPDHNRDVAAPVSGHLTSRHVENGWVQETFGFGYRDSRNHTVNERSLFAIASNSKIYTALAIGLLIDNATALPGGGSLRYDTKIKDIFPEGTWKLLDGYAEQHLDVLDLLSMRSGLPRHDFSHGHDSPANVIASLRHLRPSTELRQTWQYNNAHYFVLSHIVPTLTGIPFVEYVKHHIFDPIGMTHSYYNSTEATLTGDRADSFLREGIDPNACAEAWERTGRLSDVCLGKGVDVGWWTEGDGVFEAGAGGIVTCARDMAKVLQELLDPQVIPRHIIQATHQAVIPLEPSSKWPEIGVKSYGLGQWTYTYRGHEVIEHGGGLPGQVSTHLRVPNSNLGVMLVMNDAGPPGTDLLSPVVYAILDDVLGLDPIDWEDRLVTERLKTALQWVELPDTPRDPPKDESITGEYFNEGYGAFALTRVYLPNSTLFRTLDEGDAMFSTLEAGPRGPLNLTGPIYVAPFQKTFLSYIAFTHFDGNLFNWTGVLIYPKIDDDGYAGMTMGVGSAVVVPEKGLGMFGNFWGGSHGKEWRGEAVIRNGEEVQEESEVWFPKSG